MLENSMLYSRQSASRDVVGMEKMRKFHLNYKNEGRTEGSRKDAQAADFQTTESSTHVNGNKKDIFIRQKRPKDEGFPLNYKNFPEVLL